MGRINGWVTGEFDFEVLRVSDGKDILFRHVKITTMHESILEKAYEDFLQGILRPDIR